MSKLRTQAFPLASMAVEYPIVIPGGSVGVRKISIRSRNGSTLRISGDEGGTDDNGDYFSLLGGFQNADGLTLEGTIYVRSPDMDSDHVEILYYK